ncbi:MAG TPA: hypothetical protein VN380_15810 [Thermoanaerobaculia bacterium]|jgi:nucleotidyltransferase/DNA polymerase involved in DNA repair|nr:hypothetical protein [Thermoanaerobaculia bacterium]
MRKIIHIDMDAFYADLTNSRRETSQPRDRETSYLRPDAPT